MPSRFLRANTQHVTILLFLCLMGLVHVVKPAFVYNSRGGFRAFGMGYRHKTVVPMWYFAIILAILSVVAVRSVQ